MKTSTSTPKFVECTYCGKTIKESGSLAHSRVHNEIIQRVQRENPRLSWQARVELVRQEIEASR